MLKKLLLGAIALKVTNTLTEVAIDKLKSIELEYRPSTPKKPKEDTREVRTKVRDEMSGLSDAINTEPSNPRIEKERQMVEDAKKRADILKEAHISLRKAERLKRDERRKKQYLDSRPGRSMTRQVQAEIESEGLWNADSHLFDGLD